MRSLPLSLLGLLLLACPAPARDVSEPGFFKCIEGDCQNGTGVVSDLYLHVTMRGRFSGGQTIPGEEYVVLSPLAPGRVFKQIYGADGLLASGDNPRTIGLMSTKIGNFRGLYKAFQHPFTQRPTAIISEGSYDAGIGITYTGQFRFIPSKYGSDTGVGSGYYIFFGDQFDEVENEHKTGLFVSNVTMVGQYVQFYEANPEYLITLQEKYRAEMQLAQSERASASSLWKSVFSVVGAIALNMSGAAGGVGGIGGGGGGLGGLLSGGLGLDGSLLGGSNGIGGKIALNLVASMFDGSPGLNFEDAARSAIAAAVPNGAAGNAIATALLDNHQKGGDLGSTLLDAAGNAAIANVDRKLASSLGGSVGGNLAANTLKSALTGDGRGERQGAVDPVGAMGAAAIGKASQAVASAIAGNGASGAMAGQLDGAALEALAGDSRGGRQGAVDPIVAVGAAAIGNSSHAVASAITGNGATGAMVGQLAGAALGALAGDSREAAQRAAGDQRSDQQVAQTVGEMAAIANRQKTTGPAPAPASETGKTPLQKIAPTPPQQTDSAETVVLAYTPGKGFWDPAAGAFIKSPELMSCDNVTKSGVKLIDLPVDRRECVVATPVAKKGKPAAVNAAPPPQPSRVATLQLIAPPDGMEFAGSELIAVNEGVYIALKSTDGFSGAGKFTPEGWLTSELARGPVSIAIPNHRRQGIDEFSLRYIASDKDKGDRFGWMNMNNGAIVTEEDNDLHLAVTRYVTLLDDTESARAIALGERSIYWQKPGWSGRNFSDQFDRHDLSGVSLRFAANTGAHLSVYMVGADGSSIVNVGVDGTHKEKFDLSSFGSGPINTLIYKHHKLFVGYGDQILLIKDGKVSRFFKQDGLLLPQRATFCISNGSMYTADGRYVQSVDTLDIAASVRPFLVVGDNPPPENMTDVLMMKAALQLGIYCEDGDYIPHVFALGTDAKSNSQKIFKIYPAR